MTKAKQARLIYYRMETNGSATYLTRLTAPDGEEGDRFGQSVSQEGKFLAVGAPLCRPQRDT